MVIKKLQIYLFLTAESMNVTDGLTDGWTILRYLSPYL